MVLRADGEDFGACEREPVSVLREVEEDPGNVYGAVF